MLFRNKTQRKWNAIKKESSPNIFKREPLSFYSGFGASTGHTFAQAPHSMQPEASITYLSSPAVITSTGHSGSQAPQLMHASVMTYAKMIHLRRER